jgi:hypothetical protein
MVGEYLWDTNIVIYFLQDQLPDSAESFLTEAIMESIPAISLISEMELLCWKSAKESEINIIQDFIADTEVIGISKSVKFKTVEIRKIFNLKLPDAIIAATAIQHDRVLLTRNIKDFNRITELKVYNPFEAH